MKVNVIAKLRYDDIFNDSVTIKGLAVKISKDDALLLLSLINSNITFMHSKPGLERHFILNEWLKSSDNGIKNKIKRAYEKYYKRNNDGKIDFSTVIILNKITTLRVIEVILTNSKFINRKLHSKIASESLFRLYLLIGNEISERQSRAFKTFFPTNDNKGKRIRLHLFMGMTHAEPDSNISRSQVFVSQFLKFIQFEKWLRNKPKYIILSKAYFNKIGVDNWSDYFNDIYQINGMSFQNNIISSQNNSILKNTLDYLSKKEEDLTGWNEFLAVKKHPLYKIDNFKYLILDLDFLIEKFFTSVYHDLVYISKEQNLPDFHSDYNKEFVEEYLLNKALENVFGKSYVKFTENKMKASLSKKNNLGLPDYYIRNGNKVLIFECKNSYISHELIKNLDLKLLENDIKSKFYYNNNKRKKAVRQLLDYIICSSNGDYSFFDSVSKPKKLIYYPILVVTDPLLRSLGFNQLINEYFDKEKELIDNELKHRIIPITIIHIDDLLFYNKDLKRLDILINEYFKFISKNDYFNEMISFSVFLSIVKFPNYRKLNERQIRNFIKDSLFQD